MSGKSVVEGYDCLWEVVHVTSKGSVVLESPYGAIISVPPSEVSAHAPLKYYAFRVVFAAEEQNARVMADNLRGALKELGTKDPKVWLS